MQDVEDAANGLVGKNVSPELVGTLEEDFDHILSDIHKELLTLWSLALLLDDLLEYDSRQVIVGVGNRFQLNRCLLDELLKESELVRRVLKVVDVDEGVTRSSDVETL